ncbi:MAG: site-2 protease family protein [Planctomycetota bacterium]
MLTEPPESPYDLRFDLLGFPVRISWTFWLGAIVLGHGFCQLVVVMPGNPAGEIPRFGIGPLLLIWTLCVFVSILIHELGHALAFRRYGLNASIVLYHFGGLAIPNSSYSPGRSIRRIGEREDIIISAAGPALQLLSAALLILLVKLAGFEVAVFKYYVGPIPWLTEGKIIDSEGLFALVTLYLVPSILWALLNLVPVWPLDGGHIARSLIVMGGGTIAQSLWVSVIAGGVLAAFAINSGRPIMAIFFVMFAIGSYQQLNPMNNSWR